MTTIGTAVLQIIPSLKGVTDAIEKQIDGKVVEVKIAPKVDEAAAKKAGKDAGDTIAAEAKVAVRKGEIGKAVADDLKDSVKKAAPGKEIAKIVADDVKKESPGGGIAKVILEGLADGVKQGLPSGGVGGVIVDSISDGVLPGLKGIGSVISGQLREGAKEWSSGIAEALRGGDIQGAATQISDTIKGTTDTISTIGETFGLQLDGVRAFGDGAGPILSGVAGDVGGVLDKALTMKSSFADTADLLGDTLPGRAGSGAKSIINSLGTIIPVATGVFDALNNITQNWHAEQQEKWWADWEADQHARELGLKPQQPGVGDFGGPPAVGQGNAAQAPPKPRLGDDLRSRVAAGLLPGFSIGPNGDIIGLDGKPVQVPARALGGLIRGLGTGTSDSILSWLSNEEFVVNADATRKNLPLLEIINSGKLPGFKDGGQVGPDVAAAENLVGTPYSMAKRFDCSGDVARVINAAIGGDGSLMTTANAAKWLASRGFKPGLGGPGAISVGWKNGGPGGGHMAMTLSDGRNAEGGGSHRNFLIGNGAAGASSPQFTDHMFLPIAAFAPTAQPGGKDAVIGQGDETTGPGSSASGGSGFNLASSLSGLAGAGLSGLGKGIGTTGSGSDISLFGNAAASAVSGQVSSALGEFGIGDAPPFLQAASKLIGGISVGGGSSAAPLSASSKGGGAPIPDDAHGGRAGQPAGPQTVFNTTINARDAEDALVRWNRQQDQRVAAKLSVY